MLRLWSAVWRAPGQRGETEARRTTYPTGADDRSGTLEMLRLPPGGPLPRSPRNDAELVTYVREGAVACEDSSGRQSIIRAGEFSRVTGGSGARWTETNASRTEWAHVFRIWLGSAAAGVDLGCELKRFSRAERRGKLCLVASPDGRAGSLRIHRDALIYSAILSNGRHVVHQLPPERCAWLHLVAGEVTLGNIALSAGDGVAIAAEQSVSFTARADSEVLLLHLEDAPELVSTAGMGKVEDMRRQREARHGGKASGEDAGEDATTGRCAVCRKVKAIRDGLLVSHQKGLGTMCAGSRKPPA